MSLPITSTKLPIVIVFERHWDTIPKLVMQGLLPSLAKRGYNTFCLEAPQDLTSDEIVARQKLGLDSGAGLEKDAKKYLEQAGITNELSTMSFRKLVDLMRLRVSSKKYLEVAEIVKHQPAVRLLKDVFDEASKSSILLKGIEVNSEDFDKMVSPNLSTRMVGIAANEDYRLETVFANLLKVRDQQEEGIVFLYGALHAHGLLTKFREKNMQNEVLYYFPHSTNRFDDSIDDIQDHC
jgi:hypothetical protein